MSHDTRRRFLVGAAGAAVSLAACSRSSKADEEDVSPPEDLMREHGVLNRILLVYDESANRLEANHPLPMVALAQGADLVRRFIELYHEKLEEEHLFPRFEKAGALVDIVHTLRSQHVSGRILTETVLRLAGANGGDQDRKQLATSLRAFARMYRPHEAREDTVIFPAFRRLVGTRELHELGEQFEDRERTLFGKDGFDRIVREVATIEQSFGLYDLGQFTPSA